MDLKSQILREEEERQAQTMINHQQTAARDTTDKKMLELEKERDDLSRAISTEKQEQDRLRRLTQRKTFEDELMRMKTDQEGRRRQEERISVW